MGDLLSPKIAKGALAPGKRGIAWLMPVVPLSLTPLSILGAFRTTMRAACRNRDFGRVLPLPGRSPMARRVRNLSILLACALSFAALAQPPQKPRQPPGDPDEEVERETGPRAALSPEDREAIEKLRTRAEASS